jgi:hypothetical protein
MFLKISAIGNLRLASVRQKCPREFSNLYKKLIIDPQHHLAIHTLCSKYESYGDTVRLLCLWFDEQFLSGLLGLVILSFFSIFSGCVDYELIELVVASVYLPSQISNGNEPHCATFGLMKALSRYAHSASTMPRMTTDLSSELPSSSGKTILSLSICHLAKRSALHLLTWTLFTRNLLP